MNHKITGVNVKVGDTVNVGDVLCTFDTADLAKTVSDLQATVNATNVGSHETLLATERAVQDAERSRNSTLDGLKQQADLAKQEYDNHNIPLMNNKVELQAQEAKLNEINTKIPSLTSALKNLENEKNVAQVKVTEQTTNYNNLQTQISGIDQNDPTQLGVLAELNNKLVGALAEKVKAETELKVKDDAYNAANKDLSDANATIASLNKTMPELRQKIAISEPVVNRLKSAYDQAQKAYDDTSATLNNQVANAQGQLESARAQTSVSTLTVQEQITAYQKQLEDTNLKSTVAGTVTAVTAKAGDYYTGGSLVTIEGAESFIVESEIDEYDIADVKVGMEVSIKTDATRDELLSGEVISVAPAATSSVASSQMATVGMSSAGTSGSATYTVKVAINTPNDRLRLGMNSKISIITKKSENVLTVPYDAVTTKEDGTKIVTLIKDDNSEEEISVNVGLESGYYTEISSDKLKEGLKVKIPKVSGGGIDELLNSMGATAGM